MKDQKDNSLTAKNKAGRYHPITILIVDDETLSREAMKDAVEDIEGIIVVGEAATVKEAVDKINQLHPKVLLIDYYLPDGYGTDVARLTGMEHNSIIVSAEGKLAGSMKKNLVPFIAKPVSVQLLESAFKSILKSNRIAQ